VLQPPAELIDDESVVEQPQRGLEVVWRQDIIAPPFLQLHHNRSVWLWWEKNESWIRGDGV